MRSLLVLLKGRKEAVVVIAQANVCHQKLFFDMRLLVLHRLLPTERIR